MQQRVVDMESTEQESSVGTRPPALKSPFSSSANTSSTPLPLAIEEEDAGLDSENAQPPLVAAEEIPRDATKRLNPLVYPQKATHKQMKRFARSAEKRQSVHMLGSIEHLQHHFVCARCRQEAKISNAD